LNSINGDSTINDIKGSFGGCPFSWKAATSVRKEANAK
jgi:hypothetical protein